jgi:hypothetical protein
MLRLRQHNKSKFGNGECAMKYEPKPIATDAVRLPSDILALTEVLARNAHEIWARERTDQGWKYGPRRDDRALEHPCLVPFEDLPESEKEYDRRVAIQTLKAMVALGYRIEKKK